MIEETSEYSLLISEKYFTPHIKFPTPKICNGMNALNTYTDSKI